VIWLFAALEELADIYVAATAEERTRMATAIEALNARLAADPLHEGESRVGESRVTFVPLLTVGFRADPQRKEVRVRSVKRYGK
jgi:hypothetical protein